MPENATDHELLILLNRDVAEMRESLREALEQLKRGNDRFTSISLRDQEIGAALAGLRTDYSRAMGAAEVAQKNANENEKALLAVKLELETWKVRLKTFAWIVTPMVVIALAVAQELVKRWLVP